MDSGVLGNIALHGRRFLCGCSWSVAMRGRGGRVWDWEENGKARRLRRAVRVSLFFEREKVSQPCSIVAQKRGIESRKSHEVGNNFEHPVQVAKRQRTEGNALVLYGEWDRRRGLLFLLLLLLFFLWFNLLLNDWSPRRRSLRSHHPPKLSPSALPLVLVQHVLQIASESLLDDFPVLEHKDKIMWFDLGELVGYDNRCLVRAPSAKSSQDEHPGWASGKHDVA